MNRLDSLKSSIEMKKYEKDYEAHKKLVQMRSRFNKSHSNPVFYKYRQEQIFISPISTKDSGIVKKESKITLPPINKKEIDDEFDDFDDSDQESNAGLLSEDNLKQELLTDEEGVFEI